MFKNNSYFNKFSSHKGQLAPFFFALILVIIIAALISVNIGKIAGTKTYSGNATDGGALAAASPLAYAFNYVAFANRIFEINYRRFNWEAFRHFQHSWNILFLARHQTQGALNLACPNPCEAIYWAIEADRLLRFFWAETRQIQWQIVPSFFFNQQDFYRRLRNVVHRDQPNQFDLYYTALAAGYKFLFLNSGIAIKIRDSDKHYLYSKVDSFTTATVENCKFENFIWNDYSGRRHEVWGQICIDPIWEYKIRHTNMTYPEETDTLERVIFFTEDAIDNLRHAQGYLAAACSCVPCCLAGWWPCCVCWQQNCQMAIMHLQRALSSIDNAYDMSTRAWIGLDIDKDSTTTLYTTNNEPQLIIAWIDDIVHDREVEAKTVQSHAGNVGQRSSELWLTQYPNVKSSTRATFNYNDRGQICSRHDGYSCEPIWEHDAAIVEVDFWR